MGAKAITVSKTAKQIPLLHLVRGDAKTSMLKIAVPRYERGVDLSPLAWSVKVELPSGTGDVVPIPDTDVGENAVTFDWVLPQSVGSETGEVKFSIAGVGPGGEVWESSSMLIVVDEGLEADAEYEPSSMSELQAFIVEVHAKLPEVLAAKDAATEAAAHASDAASNATSAEAAALAAAEHANNAAGTVLAKLEAGELNGPPGQPGAPGAPGQPGAPGAPGKDAEVTPESIEAALGYAPANGADLVKSVSANGAALVKSANGNVDIPAGSALTPGVFRLGAGVKSVGGALYTDFASQADINARSNYYRPIVPAMLDAAVKAAMTDRRGNWTEAEKANARERIGAFSEASGAAHVGDTDMHVTAAEKARWNAKQDAITDLDTIRRGAAAGATALQSYTETDPTVPDWAKAATKPKYTSTEIEYGESNVGAELAQQKESIALLEALLLQIKELIEGGHADEYTCALIDQLIVDYFENKTASEVER